ncbi:hypothetical protein [Paenibacillus nasutitermitis]|uniref:Uncharacterized protein n=1 Tax=Paenibacillus nasutitermitis TaxID=1652958 RepID=A0A917DYA8_9BACL|nr:hypothetical protein [Paenibacillus nasutitermitis]GGD79083.1 hypothetical protein GCM10010911_41420 [Paenibacillus nasutitermitis]
MNNRELLKGIPAEHTRFIKLANDKGHNSVWDFVRAPDGRFYLSICGEDEQPLSALLYEYYPKTGGTRLIFDLEKVWIVSPAEMPPSKIHTSIDFLPDGKLIMTTHNTAPAPGHKRWLYEQHYEHPWEGFPGSIVIIADPDTNDVNIRGIPVPRESLYGGVLGDNPDYYYFLGYMRGHFYRLDLRTNEVKDYGKVSEFSSCRLIKDDAGRIYGGSYTGSLWRLDPVKDEIEDLKIYFESPHGTKYRRQFIYGLKSPRGTLFLTDNVDGELIELHPETLEVIRHGYIHLRPEQPRNPVVGYAVGGFAADDNFVLYYGLETFHGNDIMRLARWDILGGGEPENLGLIAPDGKQSHYVCEMLFDDDGWLHIVDVCGEYSPYILAVDVGKLAQIQESGSEWELQPENPAALDSKPDPAVEPNMHMNENSQYFMHMEAGKIRTLPLHRHIGWKNSSVKHMSLSEGTIQCISGTDAVYLLAGDDFSDHWDQPVVLYGQGCPRSCIQLHPGGTAILTSDNSLLVADLNHASIDKIIRLPMEQTWDRIVCRQDEAALVISDADGRLAVIRIADGSVSLLQGVRLAATDAHVIPLDEALLLLSGENDRLIVYDTAHMKSDPLEIAAPSIRGRAFQAVVTGGIVMGDGSVAAGTRDGLFFLISADLSSTTSFGRLYSAGGLRDFISFRNDIVGIYGDERDAGHVFYFSPQRGFVDLGRPRVIKDNSRLVHIDSEWASIHHIACLAYSTENDLLCVASAERYGCVIRYRNVVTDWS